MELRKKTGDLGEALARDYLVKNRYEIIEKNFRLGHLEIDIIARDNNRKELVFVEVKTRDSKFLDGVEEALNSNQIKKIKRAMVVYSQEFEIDLEKMRLDFIFVKIDKISKKAQLQHLIDILS
ncbi:MAG: YraN family protein [Patescibacteria group bacterium]|nr:YraN family protein [Patescibacteria group bacterium]